MVKVFEPALHEAPRNQRAAVIPFKEDESLLAWLQSIGRLIPYDASGYYYGLGEEEIAEITDSEDIYDLVAEEDEDVEEI